MCSMTFRVLVTNLSPKKHTLPVLRVALGVLEGNVSQCYFFWIVGAVTCCGSDAQRSVGIFGMDRNEEPALVTRDLNPQGEHHVVDGFPLDAFNGRLPS